MGTPQAAQRHVELCNRLKVEAKAAGVTLDKFDPDFIIGVVQNFLGEKNCAMTPNGIKSLREGSRHNR